MKMSSEDNIKMKGNVGEDLNDMLNKLSLKDPPNNNSVKLEKQEIKQGEVEDSKANKNNSSDDSGYEDDKDGKCDVKHESEKDESISDVAKSLDQEQVDKADITKYEESTIDISVKDHAQDVTDVGKPSSKSCHQDLIISGDKDDSEKDCDESDDLDVAQKSVKDVEDSGYIRRTGKTLHTPPHMGLHGQDAMCYGMAKNFPLDSTNNYQDGFSNFSQYDMNDSQTFSPYLLSSESNSMDDYASHQFNKEYPCMDNQNAGVLYDSPQSSPSPYYQNDSTIKNFRQIPQESEFDVNTCSGNPYVLTPPPSVSPPKQLLDRASPCHQSCFQIVELIDDKVDQSSLAGSGPEDEYKNLLNALKCETDTSLWNMTLSNGNLDDQSTNEIQYPSCNVSPVSIMWKDVQETDVEDLKVYLPEPLTVNEAKREVLSVCDPQTLCDLESRVSAVLSNNPMAIIPDDEHGDTNLIVLASRDDNNRDKIVEKIYALAKALASVPVCCDAPVGRFQCDKCGTSNPEYFYSPLTLSNVQGYTALSCAVLRGYPIVIVKFMMALIQANKADLRREFSGQRNELYEKYARDYPFLSTYSNRSGKLPASSYISDVYA